MTTKLKISNSTLKKSCCMQDFYENMGFSFDGKTSYDIRKIFMNRQQCDELNEILKENYLKKLKKKYNSDVRAVIKEVSEDIGRKISKKEAEKMLGIYDYSDGLTKYDINSIALDWLCYSPCSSEDVEYGYIELHDGYDTYKKGELYE